jgi:signal transduction histidine kinase
VYLLWLVLGAVLPPMLISGVVVWRAFVAARAAAERRLLDAARIDAAALDRAFDGTINILQALARSPALDRDDLRAFYDEARRVQVTQPDWYSVILMSPDQRPLVSSRSPWGAPLPPAVEPESLQQTISSRRPMVGMIRPDPRGGSDLLFPVRIPVLRGDRVKYVASAVLQVRALGRVVPGLQPDSDEWTRAVLDPQGTLAVRTRGPQDYAGRPASDAFRARLRQDPESITSEVTREGVAVYAASGRSIYGWSTVVVVPKSVLDAPLAASLTGLVIGALLLTVGGLAIVVLVSRRLSADVERASAAARALTEGRQPAKETMHLAETDALMHSIETAASLLDKRADERNEEIARAQAARADAELANRTKDQFLAVLGHELRNPLAPALTALELMRARNPDMFKRERQVLERQVAHMVRLVNDLLDVSRLARGKVKLERRRFELRDGVDRAVELAQPLVLQGRHTLTVSVPDRGLVIDADMDRVVQILSNLLTNSARYIPAGGRISVTATAVDSRVVIICDDNGPGIPSELLPKLFDPFEQGPRALDRREGGLGLGLTLARTFTEMHGGAIRAENRPEGGCRITVTLPLAPAIALPSEPPPTRAPAAMLSRRVLVVDDNRDAADMLQLALQDAGHAVVVAGTAIEALEMVREFQPEVAVIDIGLPGMNGYDLARLLRAEHQPIRLIALTGYGQSGDAADAATAGFDDHCAKPISTSALLEIVVARSQL